MICYCGQPCVRPATGRPPVYCSVRCRKNLTWAYEENARRSRVCQQCEGPIAPGRRTTKFCRRECQQRAWYVEASQDLVVVELRRIRSRLFQQQRRRLTTDT